MPTLRLPLRFPSRLLVHSSPPILLCLLLLLLSLLLILLLLPLPLLLLSLYVGPSFRIHQRRGLSHA